MIGGGAATIAVARTVRRRDASVVMVTDGPPGGDCTFTGCVPSKALLEAGHLPFAEAISRVHRIVESIAAAESEAVLTREGITVVRGYGVVKDPGTVVVDGTTLRTKRLVLATGSAPVVPVLPGLVEVPYLTNETLFELTALPKHLVVLGGGAMGCEMALAFRQFGAQMTLVEGAHRILGKEEPAASQVIHADLVARGIDVRVSGGKDPPGRTGRDGRRPHQRHAPVGCGWTQTTDRWHGGAGPEAICQWRDRGGPADAHQPQKCLCRR